MTPRVSGHRAHATTTPRPCSARAHKNPHPTVGSIHKTTAAASTHPHLAECRHPKRVRLPRGTKRGCASRPPREAHALAQLCKCTAVLRLFLKFYMANQPGSILEQIINKHGNKPHWRCSALVRAPLLPAATVDGVDGLCTGLCQRQKRLTALGR